MNKIVIVTATWCGPCKVYKPMVQENQSEIESKGYSIEYIVGDEEGQGDKVTALGVRAVPTTIVYKDGVETARLLGNKTKEDLFKEL